MKGGDISNVVSPQVIVLTDVVITLLEKEEKKLLSRKVTYGVGVVDLLNTNRMWKLGNEYGVSLELAGFSSENWTEELLDKAFEKLERRAVNPFNYWQLYEDIDELLGMIPYRPNLKGVIDIPGRVARYGSAGIEIQNF